jgi:hypothetical protein
MISIYYRSQVCAEIAAAEGDNHRDLRALLRTVAYRPLRRMMI